MRALNEGDLAVSTVVRATDRALTRIERAGGRITIGAGVTLARMLAERELAFLHPDGALDRRPGGAQHGHGRRQSVRAGAVRRSHRRAARARRDGLRAGRLRRARDGDRGVSRRPRPRAARWCSASRASAPRPRRSAIARSPASSRRAPRCFRSRSMSPSGGRVSGARIAYGAMAADRDPRQGRRTRAGGPDARRGRDRRRGRGRAKGTSPATDSLASAWYRREVVGVHLRRLLLGQELSWTWPRPRCNSGTTAARSPSSSTAAATCSTRCASGVGDVSPKFGCGQGGCGACTVLIDGEAHLSCLTLAETVEGRSVETLDGLKTGPNLHPLQQAFMDHFAAQCGYCTPGMLMAAKALIDRNPSPPARRSSRRFPATSAAAPATSRSSTPCSPPPRARRARA